MLRSLLEAKTYALEKVSSLTDEELSMTEKSVIESGIENYFFDKINEVVDDEEIEKEKLESGEDVEGYLFHRLPNYTSLLEESTKEFLSEYLSDDIYIHNNSLN